jgi:hypothetical protein
MFVERQPVGLVSQLRTLTSTRIFSLEISKGIYVDCTQIYTFFLEIKNK